MERVAKFEKVSYEQFKKDWLNTFGNYNNDEKKIKEIYDSIKLPVRGTSGSAGYDFSLPDNMNIFIGGSLLIPTGIRCKIKEGWVLKIYPRSGLGTKTGIALANTVGIIDSDYFYADNEGHIFIKLTDDSKSLGKNLSMLRGDRFCQGIFLPYGITEDDEPISNKRHGGFGSTDEK